MTLGPAKFQNSRQRMKRIMRQLAILEEQRHSELGRITSQSSMQAMNESLQESDVSYNMSSRWIIFDGPGNDFELF